MDISTKPASPSSRIEARTHLFLVGQSVRLKSDFMQRQRKAELFRIVGALPADGGALQYRIRNETEPHDRVTTQDRLEAVNSLFGAGESGA